MTLCLKRYDIIDPEVIPLIPGVLKLEVATEVDPVPIGDDPVESPSGEESHPTAYGMSQLIVADIAIGQSPGPGCPHLIIGLSPVLIREVVLQTEPWGK